MRFYSALFLVACTILGGAPLLAFAKGADAIAVRADRIEYYSDRFLLEADGSVSVDMPDGRRVSGETMSIDLRNDRMLIAGGVHLRTRTHDWSGAAFSEFFDFRRGYFLPITSEPDRWTFLDGNYDAPQKGRVMPDDAFALPDLSGERVYMSSRTARVMLKENVVFGPGRLFVGAGYAPVPSYVWNFSENPNFAQNSLSGANFDAPYNFAGGKHSLETLHFRYDTFHKGFLAYEQHYVGAKDWVTFSINPLNRPDKQFNLQLFNRLGKHLQQQTFLQLSTFQSGLSQPLSATSFVDSQTTLELPHSSIQLDLRQYNQSLLAQPALQNGQYYYGDVTHNWDPTHPFNASLSWTGFEHRFLRWPLMYKVRSGYGWNYNNTSSGVQQFNGVTYPVVRQPYAGANAWLPTMKLARNYSIDVSVDKQRSWYTSPHFIDSTNTNFSLSRSWGTKVSAAVFYTISNTVDNYGALQLVAYVPNDPLSSWDNQYHPGYLAFSGRGTNHTLFEQLVLQPNPFFNLKLQFAQNKDFPAPIPDTVGRAPYFARAEVRVRVARNLLLDLGRSYSFNWGQQRWQPQFDFRIGP